MVVMRIPIAIMVHHQRQRYDRQRLRRTKVEEDAWNLQEPSALCFPDNAWTNQKDNKDPSYRIPNLYTRSVDVEMQANQDLHFHILQVK
jgi:hypothetical protein